MVWSKWGLIAAYFGIFLMAFTTSLEGQVTYSVVAFATSSFSSHSLIATVYVIQGVVNGKAWAFYILGLGNGIRRQYSKQLTYFTAVIKPPMAKIADVFGRLEAFMICIFLYVLGYIQMAASGNVQTFAAAQIFYSAGSTGLQILQQIFIADTSNLENRALFSSLPDIPFLATVWIGPIIGSACKCNCLCLCLSLLFVFCLNNASAPSRTKIVSCDDDRTSPKHPEVLFKIMMVMMMITDPKCCSHRHLDMALGIWYMGHYPSRRVPAPRADAVPERPPREEAGATTREARVR